MKDNYLYDLGASNRILSKITLLPLVLFAFFITSFTNINALSTVSTDETCNAHFDHVNLGSDATCGACDGVLIVDPNYNATGTFVVHYTFEGDVYTVGPFDESGDIEITGLCPGLYEDITIEGVYTGCDDIWDTDVLIGVPAGCNEDPCINSNLSVSIDAGPEVCEGEEVTLTASVSGNEDCAECCTREVFNTDHCNSNNFYSIWLNNGGTPTHFEASELSWTECPNGTAHFTATASNGHDNIEVDITFSGGTSTTPSGSPKNNDCVSIDDSDWYYYTEMSGTIVTDNHGTLYLSRRGPAMQVGLNANATGVGFGGSGWFNIAGGDGYYSEGDVNIMLSPECVAQDNPEEPYGLLWSTGETTESIVVTQPGNYSVTVTNCNSCEASADIDVAFTEIPEVTVNSTNSDCLEDGGSITFSFPDHPNRTHIEFSLDGGNSWPSEYKVEDNSGSFSVTGLSIGAYDLYVRWGNDDCPIDLPDVTIENTGCATPPVGTPLEDLEVSCGEEIPFNEPTFTSECYEELNVVFEEVTIGPDGVEEICDLQNGDQHAIWFNDDDVVGANLNQNFDFVQDGTFEQFANGTAKLTGTVENRNNPNARFSFTVWLTNESTYSEWTSIPNASSPTGFREPKLDAGTTVNITDEYLDWTYYEIDESKNNEFIGEGDLAGYSGTISHRPSNLRWGVQVGDRASLQSVGHGISFWFDVDGSSYHGDFNMGMANCQNQEQEFDCADDYTIVRTWTATDECGNSTSITQNIEVNGDDEAPMVDCELLEIEACGVDPSSIEGAITDNCDESPTVTVVINSEGIAGDVCQYRTQTPGGWGASPSGNNPGAYLHANFNSTFPNGITIGCDNSFTFTTAQSITDFLPSGGSPSPLPVGNQVNPTNYGNSFAGHVLALSISVGFDSAVPSFGASGGNLSDLVIGSGPLAGMTAGEVLAEANAVIGGCASPYSLGDLHETITAINENFVDGIMDNGYFICDESICAYLTEVHIIAEDDCGNVLDHVCNFYVVDEEGPVFTGVPEDQTVECYDDITPAVVTATDLCSGEAEVTVEEIIEGEECNQTITYVYTAMDDCENISTASYTITVQDNEAPVLIGIPEDQAGVCDEIYEPAVVTATDNCDDDVAVSVETSQEGEGCEYTITYTYTAIDDCGNMATDSYSISVSDDEAPVFTSVPAALTLECDAEIPATTAEAVDNCDSSVV
ncbi:HYR-like domain-containing protein, partial [Halocola ammonii]